MLKKLLIILIFVIGTIAFSPAAVAADLANGAAIFDLHCAGCHVNGGNIIRRGKTLKQKALERNGMNSLEAIEAIVTNGKNNMSAYKDRLSEEQIQTVSAYVLEQAKHDWR